MDEMLPVRILLAVVMLGAGVLLVRTARAAASGRLRRNQLAGIRTPSTMASDEAWLVAHVRAERPTTLAGWTAAASGLFALLPVSSVVLAVAVLTGCVVMVGLVLHGARVGGRAAAETVRRTTG
ncbi:SdpI family protein [Isoptericola halotolerans]|uniref:SdpI family protein n=1 Tax=Isoptericola halotolerans TaxID=300560 RepID=UPI00388DABF4